ncbi:glycoside hydrolase family 13 protein [Streptacidiphilus sp. P02-A3a]|uniref:glycoside hydrolase family 13 protein n=1 Tax=Streptacidiphilus sp. P02-A3a TaxID=2704468 RepID=UPI0015F93778|nr:glycoside hydrolase family 13 protein [Streptacidiphilus sp. P02-A3a]QMU71269.1 glycoside hydrolase family 13 protein [Streptacidiphilus sp. P02-A3a]
MTLTADTSPPPAPGQLPGADGDWWRGAVVYQVYPRSFADGNGDGIGDLSGIRDRLGYLRDLGVDAVWLSPIYTSPQADGGYDVADYRTVDPCYGTVRDVELLVADAHALGLRVITDLIPNHCSDQHPWFLRALREGPGSPSRARFHFRPGRGEGNAQPPNDWLSLFGGPAWTRTVNPDGSPGEWYLHLFTPGQPDFNWDSGAVRDEFRSIMRYWLDRGLDGFRVDVAHGLVKAPGLPDVGHSEAVPLLGGNRVPYFDQDGVHEIYRSWRTVLDEYPGGRIAVAEAWTKTLERSARYVRPDELHQAFNFKFLSAPWDATGLRDLIGRSLDAMSAVDAPTTWTLSNHDVVRHASRYACGDPGRGLRRARAASLLMLALPGSAYLYQGEELGLPEVTDLPDEARQDPSFLRKDGGNGLRDGCRVPLPWSGDQPPYGFGAAVGGPSWLPQPAHWSALSVQTQAGDPASTLELYRAALALRRRHPALGAGTSVRWLDLAPGLLAFRRDSPRGSLVCVANTTGAPVRTPSPGRPLLASEAPVADGAEVLLPADSASWWQAD